MTTEKPRAETLLIVDDDVRVVELLQITLGGRGYDVVTAYDGDAAMEMLTSRRPELVVLDVRLPRKSGLEVLKEIRGHEEFSQTPVVLISANAATESRLQGLKLGADDYITKPFSPRELILRIRRILDRSQDRTLLVQKNEVLEGEVKRNRETMLEMQQEMGNNINRIGGLISRVLELHQPAPIEDVLERFVVTAIGGLEFSRISLLTRHRNGELSPRVSRGIPDSAVRGLCFPRNGFLVRVLTTVGRPMRIEEFEDYPEAHEEMGCLAAAGMTLIVPAFAENELRGVLGLGERESSKALGRYEVKVLEILGAAIATALRNAEAFGEVQRTFLDTTVHLIKNIEDRYTHMRGHSERVRNLSIAMAQELGQSPDEIMTLEYAALLHDLGELDRYEELMESSRVLSSEERSRMRVEAAQRSEELLGDRGQGRIRDILRHQQEHWDGTGYPDRLRGLEIPMGARIVGLANAWDALVHDRPHRKAYSYEQSRKIIEDRSGSQFDPDLVPILFEIVEAPDTSVLSA